MKRTICLMLGALLLSAFIGACGGGGGGAPPPTVGPTPPAPVAQNPGGIWDGQSVTAAAADVFTSFEFNAAGPFTDSSWASPYIATFSAGTAETRGDADLYSTGDFAWHVPSSAIVTFETLPSTLTFDVRTEFAGDVSNIDILDENGALIQNVVPANAFQKISVIRGAGQTLIGSVEVTSTSGGDVIIDDLTFGYSGSGFVGGTDDIACLVADTLVAGNRDIVCVLSDLAGDLLASAQGTLQVTNTNQVSGSGMLHAVPGSVLADGKTVANLTISGGSVIEGDTLNLTIEAAGTTSTVLITFDPIYDRGSDLATIGVVYSLFDIFGDMSSFMIDASTGAISGQSVAGCMLSGDVTIDNATFNVYNVALVVTNVAACGVPNGMYNGLGATQDDGAVLDDFFVFAVFTNLSSVVGVAEKQ